MELDKDTLMQIASTATNVERILDALKKGDEEFERIYARFEQNDSRLDKIEQNQAVLTGKFSMICFFIGTAVSAVVNFFIWIWNGRSG